MSNKNFLFHCGYYDSRIENNIYESHHNFFIISENIEMAIRDIMARNEFKSLQMHFDGAQELDPDTLNCIHCYDYKKINALVSQIRNGY